MDWPQILTTITEGNAISTVVDAPWVSVTSVNGMTGDVFVEPVVKGFQTNHYYQKDTVITYNGELYSAKANFTSGSSFNAANWDLLSSQVQSDWSVSDSSSKAFIKNKPTIGNATLTIQKNGTTVQTFTANATSNKTANITMNKTDVGLGNVDNTSDANKPISTATQTALNNKLSLTGGTMTGATYGYFPAIASTMVGNEYNILLNGGDRYTFTQSGTGTLSDGQVKGLFDGKLSPQYSSDGVNPNNPYVLLIEGLPDVHTQTGGVFGWTCRYWVPTHFKVELYDNYQSRGWVTIVEKTNTATKDLFVDLYRTTGGGSYTKARITIYDSNGQVGANGYKRWGISEIFFCHPEAISAYEYASVDKANSATKATQDANGDVITTTYAKKTEIPTVNNATLTIQKNGATVKTFTANASSNVTANITVPTKTSDLTNDSNFPVDASYVHTDNNFTTTLKNKLDGIASGAEVNVQSDWNQSTTTADDYIKNKPTIGNATLTIQKNGSLVKTFTANATSNVTANITVPTKTSDITNDSDFATNADTQKWVSNNSTVAPNFEGMTPVKTFTWSVSDTTYRPVYQMDNTGWAYDNMDIEVGYRITVTGTNISQICDITERWINPISWPITSLVNRTLSTSASTTGFRYLRAVYPQSGGLNNNTYKIGSEVANYNSTARTIKVEVFKTHSSVIWNETKPSGSIYTSSTYQATNSVSAYGTRGWVFRAPSSFNATSSDAATRVSSYECATIGSSVIKSGEALTSGHLGYQADDGLIYMFSNTTKNMVVDENARIGLISTDYNANTAIDTRYLRSLVNLNSTQVGYIPHATIALGDRLYLRCNMDGSGNIHSDNYLATSMAPGYTWLPFGIATATNTIYMDVRKPTFYTLNAEGKVTHINGKVLAGSGGGGGGGSYTAGNHITIVNDIISAVDYVHSETLTAATTPSGTVTTAMVANGAITRDKLASDAKFTLTMSTTDISEGSALATNTLYGVYNA